MTQQEVYKNVFGSSDNASLKKVIADYPYFSLPHFFLLKNTPESSSDFASMAARTSLHFNNPYFLKFQLLRKESERPEEIREPIPPVNIPVEEPAKDIAENQNTAEELTFEPLYTTDYFASQGIKLSEEVQSSDKLGKQLKSFTDWLKTMKKVHHGKLPEGNAGLDVAVQTMAEKSNKEQEVITESMAEVFVQQGKTAKAIDIYKKLSLHNPAKSAYFAAKIELLK